MSFFVCKAQVEGEVQMPHQVGHENERTPEHPHHQGGLSDVIPGDLGGQLLHAGGHLVLGE